MIVRKTNKFKLPLLLLCVLLLPMLAGGHVPMQVKSFCYALSLAIKSTLVSILPFIIFSFICHSLISLRAGAVAFIMLLLVMVAASNFTAIMTGFTVGSTFIPLLNMELPNPVEDDSTLRPAFDFHFPRLISNEPALIAGIALGIFFALRPNHRVESLAQKLNHYAITFLRVVFMPLLPVFILGFVFKLEHDKVLTTILHMYGPVLLLVVSTQFLYVCTLYLIAASFSVRQAITYLRNMLPATITGFSAISSAATMPITIMCTEKNLGDASMARTIIPATANIHTLGSALGLTTLCLATMQAFNGTIPNLAEFMQFAIYYTIAKFAVAGIPGGVIIVVAPLLETHLGFLPEMIGLITAIYMLFDPFGTATNVTCNGAFAIIFSRCYKFLGRKRSP